MDKYVEDAFSLPHVEYEMPNSVVSSSSLSLVWDVDQLVAQWPNTQKERSLGSLTEN